MSNAQKPKRRRITKNDPSISLGKRFLAGSIAGLADVWSCHALDRVKTYQQRNPGTSLVQSFASVWRKGGLMSMYEGIWPMSMEAIGKVGTRYFLYNFYVENYKKYVLKDTKVKEGFWVRMSAGAFAGVFESLIIVIPCELLKVKHMTQAEHVPFFGVMKDVIRKEGVRGLYAGGVATMARQVSNHMIRFPVFYGVTNYLKKRWETNDLGTLWQLGSGALAGTCSTLVNTPLDTLKTQMQSSGAGKETVVQVASRVVRNSGVFGLWSGVLPRIIRVAPGQAITFAVFEKVALALESWSPSEASAAK